MKRETLLFLFILVLGCAIQAKASNDYRSIYTQYDDSLLNKLTDIDRQTKIFISKDTLRGYSTPRKIEAANYFTPISKEDKNINRDRNGLIIVPFEYDPFLSYMNFSDTIILDPSMLPVVFDGKMLPSDLGFESNYLYQKKNNLERFLIDRDSLIAPSLYQYNKAQENEYKLIKRDNTFDSNLWRIRRVQDKRRKYYAEHPQLIKSNALEYTQLPSLKDELEKKNPFQNLISAENTLQISRPELEKVEIKQKFWKFAGESSLTFSQKAYSYSWEGTPNDFFSIINYQKFTAQYKKNKITFNHSIEWRLGMQYLTISKEEKVKNENINDLVVTDDYLRTNNTLELQSFLRNWSYIISLGIETPLFYTKPKADKRKRTKGPFSPLVANLGIGGISYTLNKEINKLTKTKFNLKINLAPFSLRIDHVGSSQVWKNGNKYGVVYDPRRDKGKTEEDRRYTKTTIGSLIDGNLAYDLTSYIKIDSRFKYDTDYKSVKFDNETTINMRLNRFLSTKLYVYMRYNDTLERDIKWKYFSVSEELGFGLSYRW